MSQRLSSARFRRRLAWLGVIAVVGAMVTGLVYAFPSPKPSPQSEPSTVKAAPVKPAKRVPFAFRKQQILLTAMQFVHAAVARHNLAASWDLVTPAMRNGHTKAEWQTGQDLPIIHYPAIFATWHLAYSYKDEVDVQVALFAHKHQVKPQVFDVTLTPVQRGHRTRWLVDSSCRPPPRAAGSATGRTERTSSGRTARGRRKSASSGCSSRSRSSRCCLQ